MDVSPEKSSAESSAIALPLSLFQQAIAHSANGLIICDAQQPDLPIVYASPSFEALTGYCARDVIGKNCRFLQGEETQQIGLKDIRQAIASGTGCKVLLRNYRKSGQPFWNEVTLSPLTDAAGRVTHYVGTQIDISHYLENFKALQESESRYRHLYEETPAMLHSVDLDGNIVSVSHYWLEKLGYQRQAVIGQPLARFLTPASQQKIEHTLSAIDTGKAYRDMSCQFIKKDGALIDALLSTISECNGAASTHRLLGVLVDVTERKKAEESLRRNEALLRAINNLPPTGIFVMDCDTSKVLFINPEFYRIWQLEHLQSEVTRGQITGEQLLTECLSNIDLGAFIATSTAQDFTQGNKIVEDEVPLLDGRTLRRLYGPIQENDSTFAYLYVFEDITERKQAVDKLAQATAAAEAANRAKSEFLANMSHELRSPLNAILGFTHILKTANPSTEQAEHLDIIYNSGEHLLAVINDILDISKIEAGRTVLTESEFDLYRLLDELKQMFHSAALDKGLSLQVVRSPQLPRIIFSDRLKLRQILINLLSNAIKFTATGSITLVANPIHQASSHQASSHQASSHDKTSAPTLTFAVIDTGAGIELADQARLFEAFVQTQSGLKACEGTGLGLTISREYVHLLGGELTVNSTPGVGSTFTCSIAATPIEASVTSAIAIESAIESAIEPFQARIIGLAADQPTYKILVVDDIAINRKLLTHLLSGVGFEVQEATNGQEALAQWQAWRPHLIWIDMRMPIMTGEEAARRIRALDSHRHTRLIALTASAFDENKTAALESGCDDFVSKPVQAAAVFEKMAQHLGVRYRYAETTSANPSANPAASRPSREPLTPALLAQAPAAWQYALRQATLDLDDDAILHLASQLPLQQQALAHAIETCVKKLSYKQLLQVLQEAEAVSS
jgi:PAS domain S-box-containing protein